ncbi:hypothetical protein BZA77DRAFT_355520 [Pyronema omphalodes]|nr:hypothetical protein BZA77DRAFT_355520 [Pyronema omphalodes]
MSALPRIHQMLQINIAEWTSAIEKRLSRVTMTLVDHTDNLLPILNRLNNTVKETTRTYREQRRATCAETTRVKESISALAAQIIELKTAAPQTPTSASINMRTSTAVAEMSLYLLDVQRDIQDVLDVVRDSAGKRQCACKPPLHMKCLMHFSGSSSSSPVIQQTIQASNLSPNSTTEPNTIPSSVGNAALESTDKWRIVEGKRAHRKTKATGSGPGEQTVRQNDKAPIQRNGARAKK